MLFSLRTFFVMLIIALMLGAVSPAMASKKNGSAASAALIDISRLSITRVSASSINGNGVPTNRHHGVLNLFDDGSNFINNTNYTCWLSQPGARHWIKLSFLKLVTVHSVFVETTNQRKPEEYGLELSRVTNIRRHIVKDYDSIPIKGFRTTYKLPEPVSDVNEIMIIFPGPGIVEVSEIKVMGSVPLGTDLTPQKPLVALSDSEIESPHVIKIIRTIRSENDSRMITIAENTYPPRTKVLEAIKEAHFKPKQISEKDKLWWYSEFDRVKIPYAITIEAIDYYVGLVESYRVRRWKSDIEPSSKFIYSAEVEFRENYEKEGKTFQKVYVVDMKLSMRATFASLAGIGFGKERTVIIDRDGKVLAVFGDGKTPVRVS
ncbi:MAG: hypothetical protein KAS75_04665 [Planctomycetes bacterium]|nr:hypothetical protein [Planctomycetota bacterium]